MSQLLKTNVKDARGPVERDQCGEIRGHNGGEDYDHNAL